MCSIWYVFFLSHYFRFFFPLTYVVRFSHLPVRTLLFICAVCDHGGHQSCYREYYMRQPMVDLPSSLPQLTDCRDHPSTRNQQNNNEDDSISMSSSQGNQVDSSVSESPPLQNTHRNHKSAKLAGRPCAAGCGHLCWATNSRDSEDL